MGGRRRHREPLTTAEQDLVVQHRKLSPMIAGRMKCSLPHAVDLADMISAGLLGLVKAAQDFNPTFGIPFKSYASHRIRGEILDHFRALDVVGRNDRARGGREAFRTLHLEDLALAAGEDVQIADMLADPRALEPLEILAHAEWPSALVEQLPPREARIIELYYRDGLLLREIGVRFQRSESRISQVKDIALARLKEILMAGKLTVLECVERVLREDGACLTRGEILNDMNRRSMRPAPAFGGKDWSGKEAWNSLDHADRLFEVNAALDSHPELFRNHGQTTGWTLRDGARDDAGDKAPARKEAKMAVTADRKRKDGTCEHCKESDIGEGANTCQAKYATRLRLCTLCYGKKPVREAQRKKLALSKYHHGPCPARKRNTRPPFAQTDPGRLLAPPAETPEKKPGRRAPARRPRKPTSPPVPVGDPELRTGIGACLRTSFARYASAELRAIADDLEQSAKEAAS